MFNNAPVHDVNVPPDEGSMPPFVGFDSRSEMSLDVDVVPTPPAIAFSPELHDAVRRE